MNRTLQGTPMSERNNSSSEQRTRVLSTMLATVFAGGVLMAIACNPRILMWFWQDTPPIAPSTVNLFWALHIAGIAFSACGLVVRRRVAMLGCIQARLDGAMHAVLLLLGVTVACILILGIEATFGVMNRVRSPAWHLRGSTSGQEVYLTDPLLFVPDAELNHRLRPNHKGFAVLKHPKTNATIYDATHAIGPKGWREVPGADKEVSQNHLALFGCSFTFGSGLSDQETLAAQLVARMPNYRVYNFGVGGYGTAQILRLLETQDFRSTMKEKKGIAVYLFIEDHMRRALGTMRRINSFGKRYPYYRLDATEQPVYIGNFMDQRSFLNGVYKWLSREQIVQWSGIDIPMFFTQSDYHFISRLVDGIRDQYLRQFPNGRFVVVFFPQSQTTFDQNALMREFRDNHVESLDFPNLERFATQADCFFEFDGHPKPNLVAQLAEVLSERFAQVEEAKDTLPPTTMQANQP